MSGEADDPAPRPQCALAVASIERDSQTMFSPAVARSTSIVLAKSLTGQYCLVTSASTR